MSYQFSDFRAYRQEIYRNTESVLLTKLPFQVSVFSLIETFFLKEIHVMRQITVLF